MNNKMHSLATTAQYLLTSRHTYSHEIDINLYLYHAMHMGVFVYGQNPLNVCSQVFNTDVLHNIIMIKQTHQKADSEDFRAP